MKKTYIIPQIVEKELRFAEGFLSLSKGYIQNPDGTSTGDNITIEDNDEEPAAAKRFDLDWDFEDLTSDLDLNE